MADRKPSPQLAQFIENAMDFIAHVREMHDDPSEAELAAIIYLDASASVANFVVSATNGDPHTSDILNSSIGLVLALAIVHGADIGGIDHVEVPITSLPAMMGILGTPTRFLWKRDDSLIDFPNEAHKKVAELNLRLALGGLFNLRWGANP
jgi:hypothetical protein